MRAALASATRLADGMPARFVLLVPRLASALRPVDPASEDRAALLDQYQALAARLGVDATAIFCVCYRLDDVVRQLLHRSALVVVGGRPGTWWPSPAERLVTRLARDGYSVVFAPDAAGHPEPASKEIR
jgi:hypothetical protein